MNRWKSWIPVLPALVLAIGCGSSIKVDGERDSSDDPGHELTVDMTPDPTLEPTTDPPVDPTTEPPPPDTGPDTAPAEGLTGDPCSTAADCVGVPSEGRECVHEIPMGPGSSITFPNGYCTAYCSSGTECGPGADCVDFTYAGMCFKRCTSNDDCRVSEGYVCYSIPYVTEDTYCVPYV